MKLTKVIRFKFVLMLLLLLTNIAIYAQDNKTVNITASGSGTTQKEATQVALRSAIEQTFGVFISSKTDIFENQMVADEISSISNGNIQSFKVLNETKLPDNSWAVTISAIVSVSKLTSFVQNKGISIEVQGGLFAVNIKQQILNEKAEVVAIDNMIKVLMNTLQVAYDYSITASEPFSNNSSNTNWTIACRVTITSNENMDICKDYYNKTLESLSLKYAEVANYQSLNKNIYKANGFYLRNKASIEAIYKLREWFKYFQSLYEIKTGEYKYNSNQPYYSKYSESYSGSLVKTDLNFQNSGGTVDVVNYLFVYSLEQIEKLNGFTVRPLGKVLDFRQGGLFVPTSNSEGIILAYFDDNIFSNREVILESDWTSANDYCSKLTLGGFTDWRLPNDYESQWISYYFNRLNIPFMFGQYNTIWTSEECGRDCAYAKDISSVNIKQRYNKRSRINFNPVRNYQKSSQINKPNLDVGSVKDIDGNVYKTVTIGTQTWMAENLKTTKYNDGTDIPSGYDNAAWSVLNTGARCNGVYGQLYNWFAVNTGKLAPIGWHVPSAEEWEALIQYLIANGYNYDGSTTDNLIAKSLAATIWENSSEAISSVNNNKISNNKSGFSFLPERCRDKDGRMESGTIFSTMWSATKNKNDASSAVHYGLAYGESGFLGYSSSKLGGRAIRCIKDKK